MSCKAWWAIPVRRSWPIVEDRATQESAAVLGLAPGALHERDRGTRPRLSNRCDGESGALVERHRSWVRRLQVRGGPALVHDLQAAAHQVRPQSPSVKLATDAEPRQVPVRLGGMSGGH